MPPAPHADPRARAAASAACLVLALSAHPAAAQVAGVVALDSEARLRGYSISSGRPVASLALAYDHPSGAYGNLAVVAVMDPGGPHLLGGQASIGYARRLASGTSLDVGLVRTDYTRFASFERATHYTEAYLGAARGPWSGRLSFSPDYFRADTPTLYVELQHSLRLAEDWSLTGHVGSLAFVGSRPDFAHTLNYDWRIAVTHRWKAAEGHLALSGGGPGEDYYRDAMRNRTALTVGASLAF